MWSTTAPGEGATKACSAEIHRKEEEKKKEEKEEERGGCGGVTHKCVQLRNTHKSVRKETYYIPKETCCTPQEIRTKVSEKRPAYLKRD